MFMSQAHLFYRDNPIREPHEFTGLVAHLTAKARNEF